MPTTPAPDQIAALAAAVQTAEDAFNSADDALRAATDLVGQDQASRYARLSREALAVRLAAAERTIARLTGPAELPQDQPTAAGPGQREYSIEVQEDDGSWGPALVQHELTRTPSGIARALGSARARARRMGEPWRYRAVYRDLPAWTPLSDADLDALVLAEPTGDGS